MQRLCVVAVLLTLCASVGMCQQNEISQGFRKTSDATDLEAITKDINYESYSIFTLDQARDLLLHTLCAVEHCDPTAKDFYAIIHILKWGDIQNGKQSVAGEHWYVYHPEDQGWNQEQFTDDKRLFGAKSFYLL